jgi:hypothetical protein
MWLMRVFTLRLLYYSVAMWSKIYLVLYLWPFHLDLLQLFVELKLLLVLRVGWEACPIVDMATTRYATLPILNRGLLLLLHLLVYLLGITLMAWNMHTLLILIVSLYKYILVWIRILAGKESTLSLPFPSFFNHSLLWCWALTFGNMTDCFEITNHVVESLVILYRCLWILLLS